MTLTPLNFAERDNLHVYSNIFKVFVMYAAKGNICGDTGNVEIEYLLGEYGNLGQDIRGVAAVSGHLTDQVRERK